MTSWYSSDGKEGWHWLGIAISTACSIGLHRDPSKTQLHLPQQRLCKRVWWCLCIRDRLMALGLRRPTCIRTQESDVPPLELQDYELSPTQDKAIAITHMELAKLSIHMGKVLLAQYSVHPTTTTSSEYTTSTLKVVPNTTIIVNECHTELEAWHQQLPSEVHVDASSSGEEAILLNKTILHMIYHATLSTLHRPQTLSATSQSKDTASRTHVHNAATSITDLAKVLLSNSLVAHIPVFGTTVLLPAIVKHLVDLRSHCQESKLQSLQSFAYCVLAMQKLQENYTGADVSMALVETAVQRAGIKLETLESDAPAQEYLATSIADLLVHARTRGLIEEMAEDENVQTLTPPPDDVLAVNSLDHKPAAIYPTALNDPNMFFASTPPPSAGYDATSATFDEPSLEAGPTFDMDFEMLETANAELEMPQFDFDHFLEHHNPTDANVEHEMGCFLDFDGL
jgi:hypothetical protein